MYLERDVLPLDRICDRVAQDAGWRQVVLGSDLEALQARLLKHPVGRNVVECRIGLDALKPQLLEPEVHGDLRVSGSNTQF